MGSMVFHGKIPRLQISFSLETSMSPGNFPSSPCLIRRRRRLRREAERKSEDQGRHYSTDSRDTEVANNTDTQGVSEMEVSYNVVPSLTKLRFGKLGNQRKIWA